MNVVKANKEIALHKKDAPKYAQKLAKATHSLGAEVLSLDEFETLSWKRAHVESALSVPVEIYLRIRRARTPRARASKRS